VFLHFLPPILLNAARVSPPCPIIDQIAKDPFFPPFSQVSIFRVEQKRSSEMVISTDELTDRPVCIYEIDALYLVLRSFHRMMNGFSFISPDCCRLFIYLTHFAEIAQQKTMLVNLKAFSAIHFAG
jgi:hypothetical protein